MAKPFAFQLQRVLDYRRQLEEQAALALARAKEAVARQEAAVADLDRRLAEHVADGFGQDATAQDIWLWRNYREALERDLAAARIRLQELALKLQKARAEAIARAKDRKLLEKLKENQAQKHHEEASREEQKEHDEMATIRFRRQDI